MTPLLCNLRQRPHAAAGFCPVPTKPSLPHFGVARRWAARAIATALAAVGLAAAAPLAAQVAHDFEDGTTQGWTSRGPVTLTSTTEAAHGGTRSLLTTGRTATWNGPSLDLRSLLVGDTTYQLSGWVRLAPGQVASNLKFTLESRLADAADSSYTQINPATAVTDGEWVQLQGSFSFPAGTYTTLLVYLESDDPASSYYLDDFTITGGSAPPPVCPEPLDQSGLASDFETGTTEGWFGRGDATVTPTAAAAADGNYGLRVTGRTASWQGAAINALCKLHKGSKYLIALRVRLLPGELESQVRVSLQVGYGGNTSYLTVIGNTTVTDAGWVDLSTEYTFGQDAEELQLYVETASGTASFDLDDFLLMHLPPVPIQTDIPSLKDVLAPYFPIGAAIEPAQLTGQYRELLAKHFNMIVAGNAMKWSSLQPTEGTFNFGPADAMVAFAQAHGMKVRGHTLLWHNQTPDWVFRDSNGDPLQPGNAAHRTLLIDRLRTHIHTVVTHFGDAIDAWDVVNEVIDANEPDGLRNSLWRQIIGPEFIDLAFQFAAEAAGASILVINDYNTHEPAKLAALQNVVQGMISRGVPVDAVGHQTHIRIDWPPLSQIAHSLDVFTALGLENEITELDVSVYSNDSDTAPVDQQRLIDQGYRYRDLFNLFRAKQDQIRSVVLWGLSDDTSWLKTFPITRDDKPLLFDEQLQAKPAYWGVVDPSELPIVPQLQHVTEAKSALSIAAGLNSHWDFIAPTDLAAGDGSPGWATYKAVWRRDDLYLVVDVDDASRERTDTVDVYVGAERFSFAGFGLRRSNGAVGLIVPRSGGYRLIAAVPLGAEQAVGNDVSFDVRVTDHSTGRQVSWSDTHHTQDETLENRGTLRLLPVKSIAAVKRGTPTIDGQADAVWKRASDIETKRYVLGSGATAHVKLLWGVEHLYIHATVTDPVLSKASANPWEQDSIEVFLDENNAQGLAYDDDDAQYRINFDNEVSFGGAASSAKLTSATRQVNGGYVIEAAIALDPATTARGTVLGFDVQVNDDDGSGTRTSVATWNDLSGQAYRDPSQFGAIILK